MQWRGAAGDRSIRPGLLPGLVLALATVFLAVGVLDFVVVRIGTDRWFYLFGSVNCALGLMWLWRWRRRLGPA